MVLIVNPIDRILVRWNVLLITSRFCATLSAIGCICRTYFRICCTYFRECSVWYICKKYVSYHLKEKSTRVLLQWSGPALFCRAWRSDVGCCIDSDCSYVQYRVRENAPYDIDIYRDTYVSCRYIWDTSIWYQLKEQEHARVVVVELARMHCMIYMGFRNTTRELLRWSGPAICCRVQCRALVQARWIVTSVWTSVVLQSVVLQRVAWCCSRYELSHRPGPSSTRWLWRCRVRDSQISTRLVRDSY